MLIASMANSHLQLFFFFFPSNFYFRKLFFMAVRTFTFFSSEEIKMEWLKLKRKWIESLLLYVGIAEYK